MNQSLINYEAACSALALAAKVDEVLDIRDQAEAIKAYARQSKNTELEIHATEIRLRAERRLGELLIQQKEAVGFAPAGRPKKSVPDENRFTPKEIGSAQEPISEKPPTLAEMGVDKKLSARSQKLAQVPQDEFEETLAEHRENIRAENARVVNKLEKSGDKTKPKPPKSAPVPDLEAENAALRERVAALEEKLAEMSADYQVMADDIASYARTVEADDQVTAALAEAKRFRELNRILEERLRGETNGKNEYIRLAKQRLAKIEKMEKELAKHQEARF